MITPTREELDLTDVKSIASFIKICPPCDIIINNAGINILKGIEEIDELSLMQMTETNLLSPLRLLTGLTGHMKKQGWGRVINTSSIWGVTSKEYRTLYSMTKYGINGITKSLSKELGPYNILVNSVCPGYVNTELTNKNVSAADAQKIKETIPLRRFAEPAEIAKLFAFLVSEENSYLTGQNIIIDGGFL